MRYVTLKKRYMLRGWRNREFALLDGKASSSDRSKVLPLTQVQKEAIELLTKPYVAMDDPLLPQTLRRAAAKLMDLGFLEECAPEQGLTEEQQYRYADTLLTHALTWSITGNCNLRCRHCYISCDEGAYGEPTLAQCRDIVEQMKAANIYMVALTGGEPLVRRDFWELVDMLVDSHISIEHIFSNGLMVTDSFLDRLEGYHLDLNCFLLSFDGVGWHDWMRGVPGTEQRTIDAIRRLKDRGYDVIVTTVLHEKSLSSLSDTYHLMKDLGVDFWRVADVMNSGNWKERENTGVDQARLLACYLELLREMKGDGMPLPQMRLAGVVETWGEKYRLLPICGCSEAGEDTHICEASRLFPHLLPDGRLLPCMPMCGTELERVAPNILSGEYDICRALVDSPLGEYMNYTYREAFAHEPECAACAHRLHCTRCPATSLLVGGHVFAKSAMACYFNRHGCEEQFRAVLEGAW